ncbi:MAG TPA: carbohydrate-binding protein [Vicinamibacterales bacterium]|nr:carbohydrate-binding protein [Vicinamibacterales bacterium]
MLYRAAARYSTVRSCVLALAASALFASAAAASGDVVLYPTDVTATSGNWARVSSATGAGATKMQSNDYGWSTTAAALAGPGDYFEATFNAPAYIKYHVWVRLRATGDSKYNDSAWVQFSDALDRNGNTVYPIGSSNALLVNLENCSGCGVAGWGWQDKAYWLQQENIVQFPSTGSHRVRIQTREDGVSVDQIVLSAVTYMASAPGSVTNDATILPESTSAGSVNTSTAVSTASSSGSVSASIAYNGAAVTLPGTVSVQNFDTGGEGVSYHDTTSGNSGGAFRQSGVDLESSSEGVYDIGWITGGEWVNYTVNVAAAGSYTARLRVASPSGGGAMHLGFNTASNVWQSVSLPATGGWQTWTYVDVPVTLGAGLQQMTLLFDSGGFNIESVSLVGGSSSTTTSAPAPSAPAPSAPSSGGTPVAVVTWNIQVNDSSSGHARTAMDYIAAMSPQPQVVVIQEAHKAQYNTYLDELQSRTGRTWAGAMLTHCYPGAWNGSTCTAPEDEGVAVFSSFPVIDSSTKWLPYADSYHSARAAVRLAINVNGTAVQVFGTHLQVGNASARYASMSVLKGWAGNYSVPQLAAGDFNADMDQIDTTSGMLPNFVDSWSLVGSGSGFSASTPYPTMKLDYWFADASGRATPAWTYVNTSTGTVSDHFPVVASYTIH